MCSSGGHLSVGRVGRGRVCEAGASGAPGMCRRRSVRARALGGGRADWGGGGQVVRFCEDERLILIADEVRCACACQPRISQPSSSHHPPRPFRPFVRLYLPACASPPAAPSAMGGRRWRVRQLGAPVQHAATTARPRRSQPRRAGNCAGGRCTRPTSTERRASSCRSAAS